MTVATKVGVSPQDARAETEAQIRECIQEHEAELGDGSQVIVFRRPGTSFYSMTFRIQGGYLIVTGDLGEAVYQWSERLTWDFLAGLNFGYFESKCQAHRNGYNARGWDDSVAEYRLAEYLRDAFPEESPPEGLGVAGAIAGLVGDCVEDPPIGHREEWIDWLREYGYDAFGDAWWEWAPSVGEVPDFQILAHWVGLTAAIAQLNEAPSS